MSLAWTVRPAAIGSHCDGRVGDLGIRGEIVTPRDPMALLLEIAAECASEDALPHVRARSLNHNSYAGMLVARLSRFRHIPRPQSSKEK